MLNITGVALNPAILLCRFNDMQISIHVRNHIYLISRYPTAIDSDLYISTYVSPADDYLNLLNYPLYYPFTASYALLPHESIDDNMDDPNNNASYQ